MSLRCRRPSALPDPERPQERPLSASSWRRRHPTRQGSSLNEEDEPRELSLDEIDDLSMQAIDQITARLPGRDYRTPKAEDGSSSHVMEFEHGARFEVIYDREGRPVDYRADGVCFDILDGHIAVSSAASK